MSGCVYGAGAKAGDPGSGGGGSGYGSSAPVYVNPDQAYRMNAGVRGGGGGQFQYGPPGVQPAMRGRAYGGHFSPHAQYQGPPMNSSGVRPWAAVCGV